MSSAVSAILKVRDSSRNRRFSVGIIPSRKMLIPERDGRGGEGIGGLGRVRGVVQD
jgi:hypothetical protein